MTSLAARLDRALAALPRAYPGPGGAIAVLRNGEVLARHARGWADAERRIAFTPGTLFRICSITKQFTCTLVLDAVPDPSLLDGDVRARLPLLDGWATGALHLCHNQSGLLYKPGSSNPGPLQPDTTRPHETSSAPSISPQRPSGSSVGTP